MISGKKFSNALKIMLKIKSGSSKVYQMELIKAVCENTNTLFGRWFKEKEMQLDKKKSVERTS